MNSMVLWYDLKKQGATNESMAENPVLRDLSGNGHDATCYNFAWSGMSGIGGYACKDFDGFIFRKPGGGSETEGDYARKISNFEINIIRKVSNELGIGYWPTDSNKFRCKIFVSGIKETQQLFVSQYNENYYDSHELYNGENDITIDFTESEKPDYKYATFYTDNVSNDEYNITVKLLPLYPHAIVSDGVDDYCLVTGLPVLDDFTIVAKRNYISGDQFSCIASKFINTSGSKEGAFVFENKYDRYINAITHVKSFGLLTHIFNAPSEISYMTSNSYNGTSIRRGSETDGDILTLLKLRFQGYYMAAALYSFILFDRTLTPEEIEWVKTNLIETEQ